MAPSRSTFLAGMFVVFGLVVASFFGGTQTKAPPNVGGRDIVDATGPPCLGQDNVNLDQAAKTQDFTVMTPDSPDANLSQLTDTCAAEGGGVAMIFASGISLRESLNDLRDPEETWKAIAEAYPDAGYQLATLHGQPALEIEPGGKQPSLGDVSWVEGGVKFEIEGNGKIPLSDLLAVADSLSPLAIQPSPSPTLTTGPTG